MLKGTAISPGYALGRAFCLKHFQMDNVPSHAIKPGEIEAEIERFTATLMKSRAEISEMLELPQIKSSLEIANIFQAHLTLIDDPDLKKEILKRIREQRTNAERVVSVVIKDYAEFFRKLPDAQFQGKAIDILDVGKRLLKNFNSGKIPKSMSEIKDGVIIIAEDLTPSEIVGFDPQKILGIATADGTATSHASILARSLGVPALIQVKNLLSKIEDGSFLIIDGNSGTLVCNPNPALIEDYNRAKGEFERNRKLVMDALAQPCITQDGVKVKLCANIGQAQDVQCVLKNQADGIGLYRTEFTYLIRRRFPTEQELFEIYSSVVKPLEELDVVIRTIDLGGDKISHLIGPSNEKNPDLGWRAVRISLDRVDVFKTQLRAILRTAGLRRPGSVKLLFPMISNLSELRQAKKILADVRAELTREGVPSIGEIPVGAMIEVPSAALMAEKILREADFVSIGSNDLIQYTLAVDRNNSRVAHLYQPAHPAILRMLREISLAGQKEGKGVCLCGELAGDCRYTTLLLGLGLLELSMNAAFIPKVKDIIRRISLQKVQEMVLPLLDLDTAEEIEERLLSINSQLGLAL